MSSDDFYDVMFEVSNEERVNIIKTITTEKTSFSGLARKLGITTQEVSRHFNRLVESGLATRDNSGYPAPTTYGLILLRQLHSTMFTTQNKDYFLSHNATALPDRFLSRFGELGGLAYTDDIMVAIHNIIRIIQEAEEYLFDINVPYISSGFTHIKAAYKRGVTGHFLRGVDLRIPIEMQNIREEVFPDDFINYIKREKLLKDRFLEVDIVLYMNEKEVALVSFPTLNGRHDFRGFTGSDSVAHEWCRDIFHYYWGLGTKEPRV